MATSAPARRPPRAEKERVPRKMTEDAFVEWAMRQPRARVEWVDGEVQPMSPVNFDHNDLLGWLLSLVRLYVEHSDLGVVVGPEYMVRLSPQKPRRRVPDLLFVTKARCHLFERNQLQGPPDLAVEIVSPDDPARDYRVKYLEYEEAGVKEYWIVDPALQRLEVHTRTRGGKFAPLEPVDKKIHSKVIRGFWIRPDQVFAKKRPSVLSVLKLLGVS